MNHTFSNTKSRLLCLPALLLAMGLAVSILSGCASTQAGEGASSREILTAEEIARTSALNAYEAIQIRRPVFLARAQRRALRDAEQPDARPIVYVNAVYFGDVESLRDIPVREIKDIRFVEANEATRTLGTANVGGVIMVTTKLN
jgi:hypothetical protein